jgi:hypothetical protein
MKKILAACLILTVAAVTAYVGDPPPCMKDIYLEQALKGAWEE